MTPLVRSSNASSTIPFRGWVPDISIKNPGLGVKGGIGGALSQPAEVAARYAWKYYEGDRKSRALAHKAQWEFKKYYNKQLGKYIKYWHPKYSNYAVSSKKKFQNGSSYPELQKGSDFRRKQSSSGRVQFPTNYRSGFYSSRPVKRHRCSCPYRRNSKVHRTSLCCSKSNRSGKFHVRNYTKNRKWTNRY